MPCFKKPVAKRVYQISMLMMLGLLVTSCSEGKASQCNKLIGIANQAVSGVKAVSENPKPNSIESMNKIADVANTAKTQMDSLQLTDSKLKAYQDRFVTMYTDTSKATNELVSAAEAKDSQAAQQAFQTLQTATSQEGPLVSEVNAYCNAQSSPATESASPVSPPSSSSPSNSSSPSTSSPSTSSPSP
jgi:hypothetical protein